MCEDMAAQHLRLGAYACMQARRSLERLFAKREKERDKF